MNGYVIDSSMLQSDALRRLLERGDSIAILPDFGWFELYKQQSIEALRLGLSVIGDHADKVVLLRPGGQIARLHPAVAEQTEFLILEGRKGDIREMTQIVRAPGPLPENAAVQLQALWAWARTLRPSLMEGASEISSSLPEMEEQMFGPQEIRIIRTDGRYTPKMIFTIFGAALQIWENLATEHDIPWRGLSETIVSRAYLFRYALGVVVQLLWWIRSGSQPVRRLDRMNNDLIDLAFAVHATYFGGFLTDDAKAKWVHASLIRAIKTFREIHGHQ